MSYTTSDDVWFNGPVEDAITAVSRRNCVFLVYVYDDSEKSNTMNTVLKEEEVRKTIREQTIAIAFERDSQNAQLFGQFYPVQTVPILYFIQQGTIKDYAIETISSFEFIEKINALEQKIPTLTSSPVSQQQETPASNAVPGREQQQELAHGLKEEASTQPAAEFTKDTNRHDNPSVSTTTAAMYANTASEWQQDRNADEIKAKKEKLQKQLEKARKERAERDEKELKDREIRRRQEAKMMQEARQNQMDRDHQMYFAKLKKERKEEEAHKRRVREQIARDRAEKMEKRNAEKQLHSASTSATSLTNSTVDSNSSSSSCFKAATTHPHAYSNLNIRQLDGSNIRHKFEANATLATVRQWIQQNRTDNHQAPYKLSCQFPTRLFTDQEDSSTLQDLGLCPSATIIMRPTKRASSTLSPRNNSHTGVVGLFHSAYDSVYNLLMTLFHMLTGLLATLFPTNTMAPMNLPPSQGQPISDNNLHHRHLRGGQRLGDGQVVGETTSRQEQLAQRRNPYATRIQTLHDDHHEDGEEDKRRPTYNGNSVNHE
ncbi:hypothetical protein BDF20DRAFT_855639 [Mycotypha africana]|uniref:uncharacterized protein n=1 Tax=Mycotypha africana TaxID=64632 RepID=UPI00230096F8|nr:uncharacterized protein BDF20DRAFT_855639 [Mycotypha africana]KAI8988428.1 hypothetical protein BDF20DRAFT_855639 [Mycotypha africana]